MKITTAILLLLIGSACKENESVYVHQEKETPDIIEDNSTRKDSVVQLVEVIISDTSENHESVIETEVTSEDFEIIPAKEIIHNYTEYNSFLTDHVASSGKVSYSKIKQNISQLEHILTFIEINSPEDNWSKNQKLSYWINSYNAYTLYFVAKQFPVNSIIDINTKPWDVKFIPSQNGLISLNDIEHKKIRAKFNEPRIHFSLNCASQSCPQLLNRAFKAGTLNNQLENQTHNFLNDSSRNNFSDSSNIKISSLFDWYKDDFSKNGQNVISFIQKYISPISSDAKIQFMEYSWDLND
tara:strand:- start:127 stop:1017 length:891 start_codon:yes stop_codon:yes gene_type:complete